MTMTTDSGTNLLSGAIIGLLITLLKKIPLVDQYPKIAASIIAALAAFAVAYFGADHAGWVDVIRSVAEQLCAAVGTHEIAVKPVQKAIL